MYETHQFKNARGVLIEAAVTEERVSLQDLRHPQHGAKGQWMGDYEAPAFLALAEGLITHGGIPEWNLTPENVEEVQRHLVHAIHMKVWDIPTMANEYPHVIRWLEPRYHVEFGVVSDVHIFRKNPDGDINWSRGPLNNTPTTDVRVALADVLEKEGE